ncbi:MAG: class I SAM-dependent methyltransferase [Eubacteriales bacterium]|nr:class I SAM-dependent methyltransferase [Eubacteriales bacterium]
MELSKRMQAVAQMVPAGHVAADVGCDHGFVSIYLVKNGVCPHVYATDVRPGPLARAKEHIAACGLTSCITPVLSDGLQTVPVGEEEPQGADVMIAAGMGGKLTIRILSDAPQKAKRLTWVILEPQSEVWLVRQWLSDNGFLIVEESMVLEDGKYYPVMKALNTKKVSCAAAFGEGDEKADAAERQEAAGRQEAVERQETYAACLARARKELAALQQQMTAAKIPDEKQRMACDWLGPQLIFQKSAVLLSFLKHTIKKDTELLNQLPLCASEGEKTERIRMRADHLKERLELSGQIMRMIEGESYDG